MKNHILLLSVICFTLPLMACDFKFTGIEEGNQSNSQTSSLNNNENSVFDDAYFNKRFKFSAINDGFGHIVGYQIDKYIWNNNCDVLVLPEHYKDLPVTYLTSGVFYTGGKFTSIVIPSSMINVEVTAFNKCDSLEEFSVDENNPAFTAIDGVLFSKDATKLLKYPCNKKGSYIIPNSVVELGFCAFSDCGEVTSVSIPNTLQTFGDDCFYYCKKLQTINLPEGMPCITETMFATCEALETIVIPSTVTELKYRAFSDCILLNDVIIPRGVTKIGDHAFVGCVSLSSLSYEGTVEEWSSIVLGSSWHFDTPATVIHCSNGNVPFAE